MGSVKKTVKIKSFFLDSGAFTLWSKNIGNRKEKWAFYGSQKFRDYIDAYIHFIKKYKTTIALYANVDVIGNPEITSRNQKYLESHNLYPIPVFHYGEDLEYLKRYIESGHLYIGLGGLVGNTQKSSCKKWLSRYFNFIENQNIKTHGFGVRRFSLLQKYPWFSIDNTSCGKTAMYGGLYIPHKKRGIYVFDREPFQIQVSRQSPTMKKTGKHYLSLSSMERKIVSGWLKKIKITIEEVEENFYSRMKANIICFYKIADALSINMYFGTRGVGKRLCNSPEGILAPNSNIIMSFWYFHLRSSIEFYRLERINYGRKR